MGYVRDEAMYNRQQNKYYPKGVILAHFEALHFSRSEFLAHNNINIYFAGDVPK